MTSQPLDVTPSATAVRPDAGTRLEQLAAQYDLAKAEAKKSAEALDAITAAIKLELVSAAPEGTTDIRLDSDHLAQPLRLQAVSSWRVDAARLKKEDPDTYVRYAKQSTAWRLAEVRA